MTGSSRRIFAYWLLLLLPTLAVGASVLWLLGREQARQTERAAQADEARRAALQARAQLVAENVQLLVGDVQAALLDTLAAVPAAELAGFLDRWKSEQPLVKTAFLATAEGLLVRPNGAAASEEEQGFIRRFAQRFRAEPPWKSDVAARQEAAAPTQKVVAVKDQNLNRVDVAEEARSNAYFNTQRLQRSRQEAKKVAKSSSSFASGENDGSKREAQERAAPVLHEAEPAGRRGWTVQTVDGRSHLIGWVEAGNRIRGLEMDIADLAVRLGGALPQELSGTEGLVLTDDKGRDWHQAGWVPREAAAPALVLPLDVAALPGWSVAGYLQGPFYERSTSGAFVLIAGGTIVIMILAIVTGGSLLLWQARRSEAEAQLKTSFVANVSHEFKTPLTTIRLYSELLEQGRVTSEQKRAEYLGTISRETQRLARLVNNALDFSRLEQGRKKFQLEPVELAGFVERIVGVLQPRLTEAGLELRLELARSPVEVQIDRDALEQVILNVVDNACKYAAEGRELTVRVLDLVGGRGTVPPAGAYRAAVDIADKGPGVPPAHRERIFEKFHRVDETLTAEKTGAGLGLSIARQLARGMGGDLVHLNRDGGGSVFKILLP